ncbi:MAG TPA: hypothetical protein VF545_03925 [Thermoleophilaceae bacterium]|jgi:hypothetical protein
MDEQRLRDGTDGGQRLFGDPALARRFQRRLDEVRPVYDDDGGSPIRYDESGYPLDERPLSLTGRLRRLITG